jgi:hypothetical protein
MKKKYLITLIISTLVLIFLYTNDTVQRLYFIHSLGLYNNLSFERTNNSKLLYIYIAKIPNTEDKYNLETKIKNSIDKRLNIIGELHTIEFFSTIDKYHSWETPSLQVELSTFGDDNIKICYTKK